MRRRRKSSRSAGSRRCRAAASLTVDVPGVVEGWHQLLTRFGTITLAKAMAPAIAIARDGFPVAELMANEWHDNLKTLSADPATAATFLPNGQPPKQGDIFANPRLARTMDVIAKEGRDAFYKGSIARAIVADMQGARRPARRCATSPITRPTGSTRSATNYRGYDVLEMPPSTQGFVALEMLNIMEGFDIKALGHNTADYLHVVTEAKRIAFADRSAFLADRDHMPKDVLKTLLSKEYAATRRKEIDMAKARRANSRRSRPRQRGAVDFSGRISATRST